MQVKIVMGRAVRAATALVLALTGAALVLSTAEARPAAADDVPAASAPQDISVPLADPSSATGVVDAPATPQVPAVTSGSGHHIVYSNSKQRVWAYDADGTLVRTYPVSGRRGVPAPGEYKVWSRSPTSVSGAVVLRWMVRFAHGRSMAIGFHEIPVGRGGPIQSIGELGQFRSHGCVREAPADARFMWDFAPLGTRVTVTP